MNFTLDFDDLHLSFPKMTLAEFVEFSDKKIIAIKNIIRSCSFPVL